MSPIVFIDTETTGVHPDRRPWEIAMIKRYESLHRTDQFGLQEELLIQITDVDLSNADPFGLRVGGFYNRHYSSSPTNIPTDCKCMREHEAAQAVEKFTRNAHLIGAVPSFDADTLDKMLRRHKLIPAWHYHLIDVEPLAIGYLKGLQRQALKKGSSLILDFQFSLPWKSNELSRTIGVEPPTDAERHTAMGDARWAQRTYDKVMGLS